MREIVTIFIAILITTSVWAQAPQKMSYQAVIRNSSNALVVNTIVGMRISILQGSTSGTTVYTETQSPTSNANGLISLEIGSGSVVSGNFANINWANGPYFIKTETDPTGGTNYTITSINELMSVPYAFYAENTNVANINARITYTQAKYNGIIANDSLYFGPAGTGAISISSSSSIDSAFEGYYNYVPRNGIVKNLMIKTAGNKPVNTGAVVFAQLWLNGKPTALNVQITNADGLIWKVDSTHTIAVKKGDFISVKTSNKTSTSCTTGLVEVYELE